MDLGNFLDGISTVDLLIFLYFIGFFVLGFAQGTIRRLIGIASILFSFLFAANIAKPLGDYLGQNWTLMIGFATVFFASAIAFALVAQGLYKSQPLFPKARFLDEIIGGILGLIEAALIFGAVLIILDSFFALPGIAADPQELPFLRDFWTALDGSNAAVLFRDTLIPGFFAVFGFLIPDWLEVLYP